MTTGTYRDYLEAVRRQETRDRDRFLGVDSHDGEPRYSAETGAAVFEFQGFDAAKLADDLVAFKRFLAVRELARALDDAMLKGSAFLERVYGAASWPHVIYVHADDVEWLQQDPRWEPAGAVPVQPGKAWRRLDVAPIVVAEKEPRKPPRHTYPKQRREWWRR